MVRKKEEQTQLINLYAKKVRLLIGQVRSKMATSKEKKEKNKNEGI